MNVRNLIVLLLLWAGTCLHANIEVLARFEPSRIAIGGTSKYVVEINDSSADARSSVEQIASLPIPRVSGITLRNGQASSSQQTSITNGIAEYSITQQIIIDAIPANTGNYTVPSYTFMYKGARVQVPAATLTVVERSANAAPTTDELIFLTLETPEKLYVGQTKQVTLKLYVASNVRLFDYSLERDADGFITTGGSPKEPNQSIETANGRRHRVYSWPFTITPISSGKQDLNFQCTLIVQLPKQRSSRNSPFGNSILDDLLGRSERINVYTKPTQVDVLPLPKEGQPESFSGAVGQFNIGVSTDTKSTRVGEPIMLSLKLSGQGNFDRIQGPKLPEVEGWRSYPPESVFEVDAANELKGTKRFDYIFVPEKAGTLELPEVSFSFFDPDVEKYVELTSPEIAVEVAPSNRSIIQQPAPSDSGTDSSASQSVNLTKSLEPEDWLLTLDYRPTEGRKLPTGSMLTPLFYWLNGSLLTLVSITILLSYRRRCFLQSPHYALIQNARQELKATVNKTKSDDADTFFSNAQKVVRLAATVRTKSNLRAADFATLESHFRQTGLTETAIDSTRTLFQAAEAQQFSGHHRTVDLSESRRQLETVLKAL
jgi:hypothetical protein